VCVYEFVCMFVSMIVCVYFHFGLRLDLICSVEDVSNMLFNTNSLVQFIKKCSHNVIIQSTC
jgi:hypothetical protein